MKYSLYFSFNWLMRNPELKKNVRNSSLWTCWHIMDISRSQNKNVDFRLIVSLFNDNIATSLNKISFCVSNITERNLPLCEQHYWARFCCSYVLCNVKLRHMLTCKVSRYCLLALLHGRMTPPVQEIFALAYYYGFTLHVENYVHEIYIIDNLLRNSSNLSM